MDSQKLGKILEKVAQGNMNIISRQELEQTLHRVGLGNGEGNATISRAIKNELEIRNRNEEIEISRKGVFWQKWGMILSVALSLIAIVVSIFAYLKTS